MPRRPPTPTLFPYTTLFRSLERLRPLLDRPGQEEGDVTSLLPLVGWAHLEAGQDNAAAETIALTLRRSDRKSTRLNSSHANISYAVFCLKKKICNIITLLPA